MYRKYCWWGVCLALALLHLATRSSAASAGGRSNAHKGHQATTNLPSLTGVNYNASASSSSTPSAPSTPLRRSASNRVRSTVTTTTTSTPSSTTYHPSDRDVFNLLEMALEGIDSKLRRVESMDRSLDQLLRRIDTLDARLAASHNALFTQMSALESRFLESYHTVSSTGQENLEPRLLALDEKVSVMSSKLNVLADQIDNNLLLRDGDTLAPDASETSTKCVSPPGTPHPAEVDSLKTTVTSMDRHLKVLIDTVSEQMGRLVALVSDVQSALLSQDHYEYAVTTSTTSTTAAPATNTTQLPVRGSKLDVLFHKMSPLLDVSEKMDEVWNVLVGTKSSVDTLLPTSEALLWQTQRQERAITDIHTDLNTKTKQIIENLGMVERHLTQHAKMVDASVKQPATKTTPTAALYQPSQEDHHQTLESQYHPTYKTQPDAANTTLRARIPAQELTKVEGDLINLPTDLMDSEFLQDDASVLVKNKGATTTSTNNTNNSHGTSGAIASPGYKIPPPTTGMTGTNNSPPPPPPPDALYARSISRGANAGIIFPSVKNKPVVSNATFVYDAASQDIRGYSCAELKEQGLTQSGIYYLLIRGTTFWYLKVYCDMETENGGWTVIQRRDDYGENRENFNRDWDDYKSGFGDPTKEFWLGNENIFMLTNAEDYSLRVELEDFEGNKRYAEYSSFKLYSEREQYKLEIGGYTGNAGDSLNDPWYGSNLSPFSTFNRDNDRSSLNCASMLKGGWWWKSCGRGLNGIYLTDPQDVTARQGIVWFRWRGWDYTLKRAAMMIRPRHYGKDKETTATPQLAL